MYGIRHHYEICGMDAVTLAGHIRAKRLSPVEVIDAVLDRMDKLEPILHAFCTPTPELARETASGIEANHGRPAGIGPLAGVPVGIKDLVADQGNPHHLGLVIYKDFVPDEDDVVVERLKAAGAVILGKTTCRSSATAARPQPDLSGDTQPVEHRATPGGSSAGSAPSVAAGMGPFAIGSDGGGSVRIPAAFAACTASRLRWGACPSILAAATSAFRASRAGSRSSTSAR